MLQLRHYAAGMTLAAATVLGGCSTRPMAVPSSAQSMAEGNGERLAFRAAEPGRVYVSNESNHKIYYQGDVRRDDNVEVTPGDNRITIGGRTVSEASLPDGDRYRIYFEPMDHSRVVKYRVVEEERVPAR
jgi:hypothetical protein